MAVPSPQRASRLCGSWFAALLLVCTFGACEGRRTRTDDAAQVACSDDAECDDGLRCSGRERCDRGICVAGPPLTCRDADPCTHDTCLEPAGCVFVPACGPDAGPGPDPATDAGPGPDVPLDAGVQRTFENHGGCASIVGGRLVVDRAAGLDALQGIECLVGDVEVAAPGLTDISALSSLRILQGSLRITYAPQLRDLSPLSTLKHVAGDLELHQLPGQAVMAPLPSLRSVGGTLSLQDLLDVVELSGFPALEQVGEGLILRGMPWLETLDGSAGGAFPALREAEAILVEALPRLSRLAGFGAVERLGTLVLDGLGPVDAAGVFAALNEADSVTLATAAETVRGLPRLQRAGTLVIRGHAGQAGLSGFDALTSVTQLELDGLPALTSLSAFAGVEVQSLTVRDSPLFADLTGPRYVSPLGLRLSGTALVDLHGLGAVDALGLLQLADNPALASLAGLERVGGEMVLLSLSDNDALTHLGALAGIRVFDRIRIGNNAALGRFDWPDLERIRIEFRSYAFRVSKCELDWVASHLGAGRRGNYGGTECAGVCEGARCVVPGEDPDAGL